MSALAFNANALTAAGMAAFAAAELQLAGFTGDADNIRETAAECVAPLLRAAAFALELSGVLCDDHAAGIHDVIIDYISPAPLETRADIPLLRMAGGR